MKLRGLAVAVAWGGGGMKMAFEIGVWAALRDAGVQIMESHGVSAGALVTALLIQDRLDYAIDIAGGNPHVRPVVVSDVHRWRTGPEIAWGLVRGKLPSLGRNDRLWTNYLSREIPSDIGRTAIMPGFVGAVDYETEEYLSIPHSAPDWANAVYGSATMPPPIWEPIRWEGRWLVDGGARNSNPIMDIYRRVFSGMLWPKLVIAVSTGTGDPREEVPWSGDIKDGSMQTVEIMTHEIGRNDTDAPEAVNRIMEQVPGELDIRSPDGHRYQHIPTIVIRPQRSMGGALDSSVELQRDRFAHGVECGRQAMERLAAAW